MHKNNKENHLPNPPEDHGLFGEALQVYKHRVPPDPRDDEIDLTCHETLAMPTPAMSPLEAITKRIRRMLKEHEREREHWLQERSELLRRVSALEQAARRK